MAKLQLTPAELKAQSIEMNDLKLQYESFFDDVHSILNDINQNWSVNLANNFTGKINVAQKGFSGIVTMLGYGASAANTSARIFENVDSQLAKIMESKSTSSMSNSIYSFVKPGLDDLEMKFYNWTHIPTRQYGKNVDTEESSHEIVITDDIEADIKANYDSKIDEYRNPKSDGFSFTYGSEPEYSEIGNVHIKHTTDVTTLYGKYENGHLVENASAGESKSLHHYDIYTSIESQPDLQIDLGKMDSHASMSYDPVKGNCYASAGMEIDLASVRFFNDDNVKLGVKCGAGISGSAGIHDGKIVFKGSYALGFGVEFEITVDYKEMQKNFVETIASLFD